jgi:hypothetical protein
MNEQELQAYHKKINSEEIRPVDIDDFPEIRVGTLTSGVNSINHGHYEHHVYVKDGEIHSVIYDDDTNEIIEYEHGQEISTDFLRPSRYVRPAKTLKCFALKMFEKDNKLTFSTLIDSDQISFNKPWAEDSKIVQVVDGVNTLVSPVIN